MLDYFMYLYGETVWLGNSEVNQILNLGVELFSVLPVHYLLFSSTSGLTFNKKLFVDGRVIDRRYNLTELEGYNV